MDSTDAFAQGSEAELLSAWNTISKGRPLAICVETNCPRGRCTAARASEAELSEAASVTGIPSMRYINGGLLMGEAWALRRLWSF
eukprot:2395066-Prymnesium_polylepis.1